MDVTLTQAFGGYFIYADAAGLSQNTINDYSVTFKRFLQFMGDARVRDVTPLDVQKFLSSLKNERTGKRLSEKTRLNYHTGLGALWSWLVAEGLADFHVIQAVKPPKPEQKEIVPFTRRDITLMLAALKKSTPYRNRPGQAEASSHSLPNPVRNRAIILLLLDTGLRASELCELTVGRADLHNRRLLVMGKGRKEREVPICAKTAQAVWRYLTGRKNTMPDDFLITSQKRESISRHGLRQLLGRIGDRAGVPGVYPHRFRHTFAIEYLRNGGDTETLQRILGHSDLKMIKRYLRIASQDVHARHRSASPVANGGW